MKYSKIVSIQQGYDDVTLDKAKVVGYSRLCSQIKSNLKIKKLTWLNYHLVNNLIFIFDKNVKQNYHF